jgi:serpin B
MVSRLAVQQNTRESTPKSHAPHHSFLLPLRSDMATADIRLSIAHQTRFALRIAAALSSPSAPSGSTTNAAFSPLSLHVALSLLAGGAGGATRDQLAATLGGDGTGAAEGLHALAEQVVQVVLADGSGAGGPRVAFADGVFVDASLKLKPAFEEVTVSKYKAEAQSVDFQKKVIPFLSELLLLSAY